METTTSKGKEIGTPGPDHPITISQADGRVRGSCPMWNFGIAFSLKAWIDHVVRAGKTFN
jgi:hypothetical protein